MSFCLVYFPFMPICYSSDVILNLLKFESFRFALYFISKFFFSTVSLILILFYGFWRFSPLPPFRGRVFIVDDDSVSQSPYRILYDLTPMILSGVQSPQRIVHDLSPLILSFRCSVSASRFTSCTPACSWWRRFCSSSSWFCSNVGETGTSTSPSPRWIENPGVWGRERKEPGCVSR